VNYNHPLVNRRFFTAASVALLILICTNGALAGGAYQRTDDRKKTLVWNNDPQPGDAATWTGGRDSQGYAEGSGTLTWLRPQVKSLTGSNISSARKVPISSYSGTMTRGKFEGSVTTVDHGKTYHATYADGQRKDHWSTGAAVAKAESVEPKPAAEQRPEPIRSAKTAPSTEKIASEQPKATDEATEVPAEGPPTAATENVERPIEASPARTNAQRQISEETKVETSAETRQKSSAPLIARASKESDESATPQKSVSKKSALAPGAVRAIDQPSRQVERKSEKPKEAPLKIKRATKVEEPKAETSDEQASAPPAEGPLGKANAQRPMPNAQLPIAAPSQPSTVNDQPSVNETPVDDSLRTLIGPPSSLRAKAPAPAVASPAAADSAPSIAPAPPPPAAGPKLNAVQAMDVADIQAREEGYDLGEYQLPKAEYNAADDTWSVSYIGREGDKSSKHLSVVVQDKSGKAEVKK
jgi:hypothetical protein